MSVRGCHSPTLTPYFSVTLEKTMQAKETLTAKPIQSTKSLVAETMDNGTRLNSLVSTLERMLENMGLQEGAGEDCEKAITPDPTSLRHMAERANDSARIGCNRLEACIAILDQELT